MKAAIRWAIRHPILATNLTLGVLLTATLVATMLIFTPQIALPAMIAAKILTTTSLSATAAETLALLTTGVMAMLAALSVSTFFADYFVVPAMVDVSLTMNQLENGWRTLPSNPSWKERLAGYAAKPEQNHYQATRATFHYSNRIITKCRLPQRPFAPYPTESNIHTLDSLERTARP